MGEYSLGDALNHFLKHSKLKGFMQAMQIEDVWEQIMGKTIAKYTDKIQIQGKTLYITTSMAPLKQELLYLKLYSMVTSISKLIVKAPLITVLPL